MTSNQQQPASELSKPLGFCDHDHDHCVEDAMERAETYCKDHGLRFTPGRRKVLEILLEEHRALGAYAILDALREAGFGSQPPVAYRALDFLTQNGFAHKIERLNAFVACSHPGEDHMPAFMICRRCDTVAETASVPINGALNDAADAAGFHIERTVLEAEGFCTSCAEKAGK